jgi:hypothetical protein
MSDWPMDRTQGQAIVEVPRVMSIRERLVDQKKSLEGRLAEINKALELLDANPVFEKVHDAIRRANIGLY